MFIGFIFSLIAIIIVMTLYGTKTLDRNPNLALLILVVLIIINTFIDIFNFVMS